LFHVKQHGKLEGVGPISAVEPPSRVDGLSGEQFDRLRRYRDLLTEYAPGLGLVSRRDIGRIWERHILDSLRALDCMTTADRVLADLGSGGGLPGIPVAIGQPESTMILLEPIRRRASFLELAVDRLGLANAEVIVARAPIEAAADVAMARALAGPGDVWHVAEPCLNSSGRVLYFAGGTWSESDATALSAEGVIVSVCVEPKLVWEGPLVMMRPSRGSAEERR
jgi:16S rRNA (guanine527-N7)-methyltransferase